jgi:hypothetical protein
MSFFKKLFGGGKVASDAGVSAGPSEEHNGFTLTATPFSEAGGYQLCGVISKEIDGTLKEHRFVRADRLPSLDEAALFTLRKARQLVDEQGDKLFG